MKESIIPYGIAFMVAWAVTYFTTPFCMRLAVRFGLLDSPSERRVHTRVIPRNGGLAVFLGVHTSLLVIWFFGKDTALLGISAGEWLPYLLASTVLLLVGLYDDAFSLSPLKKLAGQCFAALILWKFGVQVGNIMGVQLPVFFNLMLTLLWFGFIINAFNLIDGYDGLASGLSIVSGVGIAGTLLYRGLYSDLFFVVSLVGACFAFLIYNRHPAKIFLGDCGSMFLGLTLAFITAKTANKGSGLLAIWIPVLAMGVPVADVFLAFWRRVVRNLNSIVFGAHKSGGVFSADMEHLHHRLQKLGLNNRNVTASLCLANALIIVVCFASILARDWAMALVLVSNTIFVVVVLRYVIKLELWESGLFIVYSLGARAKPIVAVCIYAVLDLLGLSTLMFLSLWLTQPFEQLPTLVESWLAGFLLWCVVPLPLLIAIDLLRSLTPERLYLSKVHSLVNVILFIGLPAVFLFLLKFDGADRSMIFSVCYCMLFVAYYFLIRNAPHYVEQWMRNHRRH